MALNKDLIRKMIERIEIMPETYDQNTFCSSAGSTLGRPKPICGTVACLAGEAIICAAPDAAMGVAKLRQIDHDAKIAIDEYAANLMGIDEEIAERLFMNWDDEDGWPEPYRSQWIQARTYEGEAAAAVGLLKAILETDGQILREELSNGK